MTSAIYASISAVIIGWLALNVVKLRRKHRINIGDGDNKELMCAREAHYNAVENIPITLLLLFALEFNGAALILVHLFGLAFITGRIFHARAMIDKNLKRRVIGMQVTFYTILGLAIANVLYLPYEKIIGL